MIWDRWKGLWTREERWSLCCDFHDWVVHDLSLSEARAILETLRDSEKSTLVVWRTGWPNWRNLRDPDCSPLLNTRTVKISAPPLPKSEDFDPEITAVRSLKPVNPFASRKHSRFEAKFPVTIVSGSNEFKTETLDLSEGGLRVRDTLPDWVAGYCSAILEIENGRTLEVMCSLAEDQKQGKSRLEIVASDRAAEFVEWFRQHPQFKEA